jgi:hypothetical protein
LLRVGPRLVEGHALRVGKLLLLVEAGWRNSGRAILAEGRVGLRLERRGNTARSQVLVGHDGSRLGRVGGVAVVRAGAAREAAVGRLRGLATRMGRHVGAAVGFSTVGALLSAEDEIGPRGQVGRLASRQGVVGDGRGRVRR